MNENNINKSYLDRIRLKYGVDKCRVVFLDLIQKQREKAVSLINDKYLSFVCLFILKSEIEDNDLFDNLNSRNIAALKISNEILENKDIDFEDSILDFSSNIKTEYSVLKWMLKTGAMEDGINNELGEILDVTVSLLINTYKDKTILPIVAKMIFNRNKKGLYIHDLVWAFFRTYDPYTLKLIAGYLRSKDQINVKLACKLLNIEPIDNNISSTDKQKRYNKYILWLKENDQYLYFTGESFQLTSKPVHCNIDLERRYICKGVSSYVKEPFEPSSDIEKNCIEVFNSVNDEDKNILSKYSNKIRKKDISSWNKWIQYPISEQIKIAKNGLGGLR